MPFDEAIENRIKKIVSKLKNCEARKMFGGLCYLLDGHMFCGVYKDYLILRMGEPTSKETLKSSFARPFDITGRPMKGWVMLGKEGFKSEDELKDWLEKAEKFVRTLPPK
ncbi:MAG: TfoX/Sxy family protein [Thermodesulfobacteriota bacterium]|nr:TfoX/Sxy family protein [Thermodesulfobacteriota bacterium]